MLKSDVIAYFDNSPIAVARALDITRSAVNQWRDRVPLECAIRLQALTHGALSFDMKDYDLPALPASPAQASGRLSS